MWIMSCGANRGRIARVKNPDDVPEALKKGIWTDGVRDNSLVGAWEVKISRAKDFPWRWIGVQPGCYWRHGGTWCGPRVVWDGRYFVTEARTESV